MTIEIEILAPLTMSKAACLDALKSCIFIKTALTRDHYYNDSSNRFGPDKDGRLSGCLRLRVNDDESSGILTFKKDHYHDGIWSHSDEHESTVNDVHAMHHILMALDYTKLVIIETEKTYFLYDPYMIVIEDVKNLGLFIEIEMLKEEILSREAITKIKGDMLDTLASLGISHGEELNAGKPELMLRNGRT